MAAVSDGLIKVEATFFWHNFRLAAFLSQRLDRCTRVMHLLPLRLNGKSWGEAEQVNHDEQLCALIAFPCPYPHPAKGKKVKRIILVKHC